MSEKHQDIKRIATNTLAMYFRMFVLILISLYTTRKVLEILGVDDFGIYNVIFSSVVMFTFLQGALAGATQRFFSYELGKTDENNFNKIFNNALSLHCIVAVILLLIAETGGLYFVNTYLSIPAEKMYAMNWLYQFSVLIFLIKFIQVPYHSTIIAHEKLNFFAWTSVIEASLQLGMIFSLSMIKYDKLIFYGAILLFITFMRFLMDFLFCHWNYRSSCKIGFRLDKILAMEILSFSGWRMVSSVAFMAMNQGCNIVLNIFLGAAFNASMAIAQQVLSAVTGFIYGFRLASDPQIIKLYADGKRDEMNRMVMNCAKATYFLVFIICVPLILEMKQIIFIWLENPPPDSVLFCRLMLIYALVQSYNFSLSIYFNASGNLKKNQIYSSIFYLLVCPAFILCLKAGLPAASLLYLMIIAAFIVEVVMKLILLRSQEGVPILFCLKKFYLPTWRVSAVVIIFDILFMQYFEYGFIRLVSVFLVNTCVTGIVAFYWGLTNDERERVVLFVKRKLKLGHKMA